MMRIKASTRRSRVAPVNWGAAVPVRDQQPPDRGSVARAHKERILQLLVDTPEGASVTDLAEAAGLSRERAYTYITELNAEGLVGKFGTSRNVRWTALV